MHGKRGTQRLRSSSGGGAYLRRGVEGDVAKGLDRGLRPALPRHVLGEEHVVGEDRPKLELLQQAAAAARR